MQHLEFGQEREHRIPIPGRLPKVGLRARGRCVAMEVKSWKDLHGTFGLVACGLMGKKIEEMQTDLS